MKTPAQFTIDGFGIRRSVYDRRQIICPHASLLGYGTCKLRVGDVFLYKEHGQDCTEKTRYCGCHNRIGRMIARLTYAPASGIIPAITKPHILALSLHGVANFAGIRWIDPVDVVEIRRPNRNAFARWFFSERLPYSAEMLVRLADYGTLSESYIDGADAHVREWTETK